LAKPWSQFRIYITVLRSKNAFEKVPFLLVRFLWMNDWLSSDTKSLDKERTDLSLSQLQRKWTNVA